MWADITVYSLTVRKPRNRFSLKQRITNDIAYVGKGRKEQELQIEHRTTDAVGSAL